MAFKTDTIQLKEYAANNDVPAATNGELAVVGSSGNRVLKLRDNGQWKDLSGTAGASQLNELSDVLSAPASGDPNNVAFVVDDGGTKKLDFGPITTAMINTAALDTGTQASDDDTIIMSSKAIKNRIANFNYNFVRNQAWTADLTLAGNAEYGSITWVNTADPDSNELEVERPGSFAAGCVITIMNAQLEDMSVIRDDGASPEMKFNCVQLNSSPINNFTLAAFQKAILIKTSSNNWEVVIASI